MKVAIIGAGNVGLEVFRELQKTREVHEITLIGRNLEKLRAEVRDHRDAAVLRPTPTPKLSCGGYAMTKDADILVYAAGSAKIKSDRMELLEENCRIAEEVFSEVDNYNRDAIVICLSNPLDVITTAVRKYTGRPHGRVLGTGTMLDSARLIRYVADLLDISERSVNMFVVGEHGNSSVTLLSSFRIIGMTLDEYFSLEVGDERTVDSQRLTSAIRAAGRKIANGKGFTSVGVAAAASRLVSAIAADAREILPVSVVLQGEYGVRDIALSVPVVVGRNGAEAVKEIKMTAEEEAAFQDSAQVVREACRAVGLV